MNTYKITCLGEVIEIEAPDEYAAFDAARHYFGWNAPISFPRLVGE
jgi:hypothetical protein